VVPQIARRYIAHGYECITDATHGEPERPGGLWLQRRAEATPKRNLHSGFLCFARRIADGELFEPEGEGFK
jgi:hypothetical protein